MKIVLDTNVLVSGLLNPHGPPGEIVRLISADILTLCYDARILIEYRSVLARPRFQFDIHHTNTLLNHIQTLGDLVAAPPLSKSLPDPKDDPFLAVAFAANAAHLITGNTKHFPKSHRQNLSVVSPTEFITRFR